MKTRFQFARYCAGVLLLVASIPSTRAATAQVLGWNNLGMHCMDSDYSVFSVLPPYNTIEAQMIVNGRPVTNGTGYSVTYEAVADPDGSINRTATGKGNFSQYALPLYGVSLPPEMGLAGWAMPGALNTPQAMLFEATNRPAPGAAARVNWFRAEGIPITPYDDAGRKNPYPLMRLIARNGTTPVATNDIVLPVSDEMDCRACHASGTSAAARPAAGWVWSTSQERDFRLNILRMHDEHQTARHPGLYAAALAARGFNSQGLYRSVVADAHPVLCATCHASEALGTGSYSNIPPLTASVHSRHATVLDTESHLILDDSASRSSCYRCHPGSTTRCLRGAMGGAVARNGSMEMQCQSCHGNMSAVGSSSRVGWFMEPNCQSCHSGTATLNNGQIRYTSCFETNGAVRTAVSQTFATKSNTPAAGISLFRFSAGHGGLQCEACHGSTHAEFPSTHRNDNLRNERIQGHAGTMVECTACHVSMTASASTVGAGPHGMHPVGQTIVDAHPDMFDGGTVTRAQCQACHGTNYRGTVLSRVQGARSVTSKFGTRSFWRGQFVGCYDCHNGASSSNPTTNTAPVLTSISTSTRNDTAANMTMPGGSALTFRIVSQSVHGSVSVSNTLATYYPEPGFIGVETFTFAANNGFRDSNLATGTVTVVQGTFSLGAVAHVPESYPMAWPVAFAVVPSITNHTAAPLFSWTFGDGSAASTNQFPAHAYTLAGTYNWRVVSSVAGISTTNSGSITIGAPMQLASAQAAASVQFTWPATLADAVVETTPMLGEGAMWQPATNLVTAPGGGVLAITISNPRTNSFFRLRQVW